MTDIDAALRYADSCLRVRQRREGWPGYAIGVWRGDRLALTRAAGWANVETRESLTPAHRFRVASLSKMFTATAIVLLVREGRLALEDPVAKHVACPGPTGSVRLADLLGHRGGVPRDGGTADFWNLTQDFPTDTDLVAAPATTVARMKARFKYSNVGYALLGMVIESIVGRSFDEVVTHSIIDVLGLASTTSDLVPDQVAPLATGHFTAMAGPRHRPLPHVRTNAFAPATGLCSTVADICAFAAAHFDGSETLLSDAERHRLREPRQPIAREDASYALGFEVRRLGKRDLYGHPGGFPGFRSCLLMDPADRLAVAILANAHDVPVPDLVAGVFEIVDGFADSGAPDIARSACLARYEGRFEGLLGVMDVVRVGRRLVCADPRRPRPLRDADELEVLGPAEVKLSESANGYHEVGETLRYTFRQDGRPASVVVGGVTMIALDDEELTGGWPR